MPPRNNTPFILGAIAGGLGLAVVAGLIASRPDDGDGDGNGNGGDEPPFVTNITFEPNTEKFVTPRGESDLWPMTERPNGELITAFGDGPGFGSTERSLGFARLTGSPPNISGQNRGFIGSSSRGAGKTLGIISLGNDLYSWVNTQNNDDNPLHRLYHSGDGGNSWDQTNVTYQAATVSPHAFVQFGRNNAPDGFIYMLAGRWLTAGPYYLARVSPGNITSKNDYEWFRGMSGNTALWGAENQRQGIVDNPGGSGNANDAVHGQMFWNPGLEQFFLTQWHGGPGGLRIYVGPHPWGPFREVFNTNSFRGMSNGNESGGAIAEGLSMCFPEAWMSNDGETMWASYSVWGSSHSGDAHDRLVLIRCQVQVEEV